MPTPYLNDLFRGVHTLKGLSGMFGFERLGRLSHVLEDTLEDLRMGRIELSQPALDVLFDDVAIANNDYVSPRPIIAITLRESRSAATAPRPAARPCCDRGSA